MVIFRIVEEDPDLSVASLSLCRIGPISNVSSEYSQILPGHIRDTQKPISSFRQNNFGTIKDNNSNRFKHIKYLDN